jgi:hypothetical protein
MRTRFRLCLVAFLSLLSTNAGAQCVGEWRLGDDAPSGVDWSVEASTVWDPDGDGPAPPMLMLGGLFVSAAGVGSQNLVGWDGRECHAIGSLWQPEGDRPIHWNPPNINALCVFEGDLIAGIDFGVNDPVTGELLIGVARWDGTEWHAMSDGLRGSSFGGVLDLIVFQGELYATGDFASSGEEAVNGIARWDGSTWRPLEGGLALGTFRPRGVCMAIYRDELIVGGNFDTAGGVSAKNIARWDGETWHPLGDTSSFGSVGVGCLCVHDGALVVGGDLGTTSGNRFVNFGRWDGETWTALAPRRIFQAPADMLSYAGQLYVTGNSFVDERDDGWYEYCVGILDNDMLVPAPFEVKACPETSGPHLDLFGSQFFVYSDWLFRAGNQYELTVAYREEDEWHTLGGGMDWPPTVFLSNGANLYVGGWFHQRGDTPFNNVGQWDGTSWSSLGAGIDTPEGNPCDYGGVRALAIYDGALLAGGSFETSNGADVGPIARWNGTSWEPFGQRVSGSVYSLLNYRGDLIAGGTFSSAGGQPMNRVTRWDGSAWQPMGTGLEGGSVSTMIVYDDTVIALGSFSTAGGRPAPGIASWNGEVWTPLPALPMMDPRAMIVYQGDLLIGGGFLPSYLVRWNGAAWLPLDNEPHLWIRALGEYHGDLIVSEGLGTEGDGLALRRWNGTQWIDMTPDARAFPSGIWSLAEHNDELWIGASTSESRIWRFRDPVSPVVRRDPSPARTCRGASVLLSVDADGVPAPAFEWRRDSLPLVDGESGHGSIIVGSATAALRIDAIDPADAGSYDCVVSNGCGTATSAAASVEVCLADFNCSGTVNSQDFFDFLNAFFANDPAADFNADGVISSQDFYEFLTAFFAGC